MAQTLSFALELRDPAMRIAGHCARVAMRAVAIAEELGVPHAEVEVLRHAAELHEVGIVSVPGELLHRPGPLSRSELERVRAHAWVGAEIVRSVYSPAIARLVEHQYDDYATLAVGKWVSGRELLLVGVLRVADVLDAMTVPRAYQEPLSREHRADVLRQGALSRFHPVAVETALRLEGVQGG
jgi:HD-GYP domain-containing protein (c-di-GMP phosphodiesterase class II)